MERSLERFSAGRERNLRIREGRYHRRMRTPAGPLTRIALACFAAALTSTIALSVASAQNAAPPTDCPPGSVGKASGAFTWCEPTVCVIDTDCGSGMVCRTMPLCMNAGTVGGEGKDAATRLSVTNVCGPNKSCPNDTVCSELPRCIETAVAKRMNLTAPGASAAPASSADLPPPKKSSCGCTVVGARTEPAAVIAGALVIVVAGARRRRRPLHS
jgi:MYXO-CTERM domain-containing protein